MEISILSDLVAHLYSKIIPHVQSILHKKFEHASDFTGYTPLEEGFLFGDLEKEEDVYHIEGNYAYGKFDKEIFHLTFNIVSDFYPGPDMDEGIPSIIYLNEQIKNIGRIANYGLENLTHDIQQDIIDEIIVDDIFRIQVKNIHLEFEESDFVWENDLPNISLDVYSGSLVLKIHLELDIIDERDYQIGGSEYTKGAKRFDKRKGNK